MGTKSLAAWLVYFLGGRTGLRAALAECGKLGLDSAALYSPLLCEVCGGNAAGWDWATLPDPAKAGRVYYPKPMDTLHVWVYPDGQVGLRLDNSFCAGEGMVLGKGRGGECNCAE